MLESSSGSSSAGPAAIYSTLTTAAASDIVGECLRQAEALGRQVAIAVVGRDGRLLLGQRPHDRRASLLTLAMAKASTAVTMEMPTASIDGWQSDKPDVLANIRLTSETPIIASAGGMPIVLDGALLGGLGVSGAPRDGDDVICRKALGELRFTTNFAS